MTTYGGETLPITNRVIILGKDVEYDDEGQAHLSAGGQQRTDRFLEYYNNLRGSFSSREAQVITTGGSSFKKGEELSEDLQAREGRIMADYLVQQGVPHRLIEIEEYSTSTITNFTNSIQLGLFHPSNFSKEEPLGVVSHPHHLKRAGDLALPLGFSVEAMKPIPTKEKDSAVNELVLRSIYRTILLGAKDPFELVQREEKFFKLVSKMRGNKSAG